MRDPLTRIAVLLLGAVTALIGWWAWKQGAYFGTVFYPGALAVFALLGLMLAFAPFRARIKGPARTALLSLLALTAWMLLSTLWSSTPAAAVAYAAHGALYAALFGLGIWIAHLLGSRSILALSPLVIAGAVVAIATVIVLATGTNVTWYLHSDATLRFPIGYRNANAAFFMICVWAALALGTEVKWRWQLRALAVGAGTILLELAFLAQSRGSIPAVVLAALVYLVLSSHRLRAAAVLALMAVPALPAIPTLLDVYRHGKADAAVVPLLHDAARAVAGTGVLSLLIAALVLGAVAPRLRLRAGTVRTISWSAAILAVAGVLGGGAFFVAEHGGPVGFVNQRAQEFDKVGYPNLHGQGIRYGANIGSNRHDFWRVAIDEGLAHPLLGGGAGSFQTVYLRHRLSEESPEDPHSVEALMFSELGLPGIVALVVFIVAAATAGWRSRRLDPAATGLVAGALAGATQWFVQASYDWIWNYPGITAPAIFVLGAAAAPALIDPAAARAARWRVSIGALLAVAAIVLIPFFLAERYLQRAYEESASDPHGAISDLSRAADLNPLEAAPLLAKGVIASRQGEETLALSAFHEASGREPEDFAPYLYLASELARTNPRAARVALGRAGELDPQDPGLAALRRRLNQPPAKH